MFLPCHFCYRYWRVCDNIIDNVDLFAASAVQEELVCKYWMLVAYHPAIMLAITKYQDAALVPMCRTENAPSRIYGNSIQATF